MDVPQWLRYWRSDEWHPVTAPTPDERARLRAVAEAATPGPWMADESLGTSFHDFEVLGPVERGNGTVRQVVIAQIHGEDSNDHTHIAAFDPPTVLALLDALDAAEAAYADLEAARLETMDQRDEARRKLAAVEALQQEWRTWTEGNRDKWARGYVDAHRNCAASLRNVLDGA